MTTYCFSETCPCKRPKKIKKTGSISAYALLKYGFTSYARKPQAFKPGNEWHPFEAKRRPSPTYLAWSKVMSGMPAGQKPWPSVQGVVHFLNLLPGY